MKGEITMFKFIESTELDKNVNNDYIDELERKYNIKFPRILREYYLNYNCSKEKECTFKIDGIDREDTDFILDTMIPLKYGTICLEKEYEWVLKDEYISNEFIPLAYDMDSDRYYWNSKTGKVYYISQENVENPILLCNSVEDFFDILNRSCEKNITIPNLNISKEMIEESKLTETDNNYDVDKILKYNSKFILKCNLILLACIIICLILMPMTDGLSVVIAGVFGVWLLIFIVIDIINRIISGVALRKYDLNEIKRELSLKTTRKLDGTEIYLTDNYIISNSKKIYITKYSDIVWTYLARPMGTTAQQAGIGTAYKFGGNPVKAHLKNGKEVVIALVKNNEQLNKIFRKISKENSKVLIGETHQNIKAYEKINSSFRIKNKLSAIFIIIMFLLIVVGFIYVNFIK